MTRAQRKQLERIIADARQEIETADNALWLKKHEPLIGHCFKYRNSYGGDETWPLYGKVMGIEGCNLVLFLFEETPQGIEIKEKDCRHSLSSEAYALITENEFCKAWNELTAKIGRFNVLA